LIGRFKIGIELPYGNSTILPNSRQFFVGDTNSLQAFVARSIGPGSYDPPVENISIDQTGDIKLESNIEYRFGFSRLLRSAFFVDVGNIWLLYEDESRPGSAFSMNKALNELAIGSGFGLRIDAEFLVVRLDLAFPLKIPYRPAGNRWVIQDVRFFDPNWRKENLMLNFAIGYPF
jgi:outer membrane protein assembly factor BamA